ncbi:MAG: hypothetical protein JO284_15455, partial [Planctomycetaceae bacterium]|nr:hypothetical protein [Planctomycetaceae bacterium]
ARAWLRSLGFPDPVICDSGNGFHLLYQIWLPNDDASKALIEGVLKALAARFDTEDVKVDTGLFDANRIDKVYGTKACKGPGTTERPHRCSRVLQVPDAIEPVATALLEELAAESKALDLEAEIPRTPAAHAAGDGAGGPPVPAGANGRPKANGSTWVGTTVADDYRARGPDWGEILEGWTLTATLPDGERRWTRPGKDGADGISATTGHAGQDCFHVFSDQAQPFAPHESYSKFQAYALLNHGGDESQAAAELYKAGYGTRQPPPPPTDDDRPGWHKDGAAFLDDGPPNGHPGAFANGRAVTRRREPGDDDDRGDAAPVGDAHGAADRLKRLQPTEGVVEAPDDPHKLARTYVAERYAHPDHPRLVYYNEDFHEYRDGCYRRMPDGDADVELTAAIKREFDRLYFEDLEAYRRAMVAHQIAMKDGGDWEGSKPVPPKVRKVKTGVFNDTRRALRSVVGVPHTYQQPCWLTPSPDAPPPRAVLPAKNALVDLSSVAIGADGTIDLHAIKVIDPTPAFFSPITLHYPFDPDAPDPTRWLTFLEEVFPGDVESQRELQKWFGYLITMDTKQQKMLYLIGRSRSGKGTVVRVLTDLVGQLNCASPALMDLAEPFGLSNLPGKTLMTITDARISKDDKELARLQERLLKISGEDLSQINRKNKPIIEMKLLTRVVIASNEVPAFRDPSGAFKERMRPLRFQVSFAGKEDPDLFGKLRAEMGGILNWAIKGQALLVADGGFLVPRSARGLVRSLQEAATPLH